MKDSIMNVNDLDLKKTGVLFFDILNGYYHAAEPAKKARMKPWIDNAVRLMKAGRVANLPIFFGKGNHRADGRTSATIVTDTDMGLKPWPNGEVEKFRPHIVGTDKNSDVIPELEPRPDDYYIPKYRWSTFHQTYFDLALRARGIDTIIISGGSTDVGVVSTVFAGRDLDYNMIVVRDACGSSHDDRAHDVLMDLMFPRMARVRTTDQTIKMIEGAKIRS
jgi:nicotinamidase-related amidase